MVILGIQHVHRTLRNSVLEYLITLRRNWLATAAVLAWLSGWYQLMSLRCDMALVLATLLLQLATLAFFYICNDYLIGVVVRLKGVVFCSTWFM